jgi:lauroyl/myristoyl acyltransferase
VGGRILSNKSAVFPGPEGKDFVKRRRRNLAQQPACSLSDLLIALGLASLLIPAWILPESWWAALWRAAARNPLLTSRGAVRLTAKSIQKALGDVDRRRAEDIAQDLKACVYEMRFQDLRAWRPGGWRPTMRLEGEEHLLQALSAGKGAVLWLAPFVFNSGPTKIIIHQRGHKVSHLSSPRHGFSETRFGVRVLNRIRCIPEDRYLEQRIVFDRNAPSTAMRRMMRALKAGEVVSIVAASTEGSEFVKGPVFGGRLPVAVGAPRLAGSTGAPLLPCFTVRDSELGFRIVIGAPIALDAGRPAAENCAAATAEFLRRSESWVRQYPEQWRAWSKWRPADNRAPSAE